MDNSRIYNNISNTQRSINNQMAQISLLQSELQGKNDQIFGQAEEIANKKKLLETRNRMLQLSIERNVYKKKVIYTLFSIILAILIIVLVSYSYFNRK